MWKWILRAAVAAGLDQWAKRKALDLAKKIREKAMKKIGKTVDAAAEKIRAIEEAANGVPPAPPAEPSEPTSPEGQQ